MTQLKPSGSSPVHFLVPLPGAISPSALDLFGFWTYELRCGHLQWSTAQGRFGRAFRVAGVQHPCPPLTANVERINTLPSDGGAKQPCIVASADLAQTVLNGQSLTAKSAPQTQIWFLLYAQLRRADGGAYRNLLLSKLQGIQPVTKRVTTNVAGIAQQQAITVRAAFSQAQIDKILAEFRLPFNTPLSVLAVELFNNEFLVIREQDFDNAPNLDVSSKAKLLRSVSSASDKTTGGSTATSLATPTTSDEVSTRATAAAVAIDDPLGQELGSQRILRTSPLTPVRAIC